MSITVLFVFIDVLLVSITVCACIVVCKINVNLYLLIKLLLGKSYRCPNYTVVITIWLAVTKYPYLK